MTAGPSEEAGGSALVVSNTTPVSNLIRIGQLPLLERLFGRVLIPEQVAEELEQGKHILGDYREAPGAAALITEVPLDGPLLRQLAMRLDEGEARAIALALAWRASLVLMDELAGRKVAAYHGLRCVGTLGVLLEAKRQGHVEQLGPLVEALERASFRMSAELKAYVLRVAGEG